MCLEKADRKKRYRCQSRPDLAITTAEYVHDARKFSAVFAVMTGEDHQFFQQEPLLLRLRDAELRSLKQLSKTHCRRPFPQAGDNRFSRTESEEWCRSAGAQALALEAAAALPPASGHPRSNGRPL